MSEKTGVPEEKKMGMGLIRKYMCKKFVFILIW